MKRIWIALVSLAVVIMMGAYWCYYINQSVDELRRETEQVLQLMDEAPEQAKEPLERISGKWEQKEKTMDYIVLHDHIDEAKTALSKCRQYYTQQEYRLAQTELYLFSDILEEIAEKEQPSIENIL